MHCLEPSTKGVNNRDDRDMRHSISCGISLKQSIAERYRDALGSKNMLLGLDSSILCMFQAVSTYAWQALDSDRRWTQAGAGTRQALFCLQTSPVALELILLSPGCSPQTHVWPVLLTTEHWIRCLEVGLKEEFLELA